MKIVFTGIMTACVAGLAGISLVVLAGCSGPAKLDSAEADAGKGQGSDAGMSSRYPERVLWGDEHVHTGWSGDAGLAGATLGPEEALRFARGEQVKGSSGVMMKLQRPLDWVAITDHSDGMGAISELRAGNPEMLADPLLKRWYEMMSSGDIIKGEDAKREAVDAQANQKMPKIIMDPKWGVSAWKKTLELNEKYNEPGKFTALIGYEWTSNGEIGRAHV